MLTNIQRYFRYYLALVLATLLALGTRLAPAAPLPGAPAAGVSVGAQRALENFSVASN
ncbi:hypothetical protein [Hymenobacter coccineus]|uniref:hypothetical protein n=1 Tax=Hymenobacter coccineus TaxID=1908235 RepID=UPI0013016F08|nr:hypothetical protein [Hymenobacter coccineus]